VNQSQTIVTAGKGIVVVGLVVFLFFLSGKLLRGKAKNGEPEKPLTVSGEMTVEQFGRENHLGVLTRQLLP
jgi:hypothetical protein